MAKRIDILFGSRIDESGAKKDIQRIKTIFKSSDLKIVPQIDNSVLKEFQRNLKVTIDEATKLKTLTSGFTQNGVKYSVTQKESAANQWSKPTVSIDYIESMDTLEKKLKSLYRTAIETQTNINNATKTGADTYKKYWEASLNSIEEEIKKTESSLSSFGVNVTDDRTIQRLSDKLDNAKTEQGAIEQKKAFDDLEVALSNLTVAETKLEKAQAYHSSSETITALQEQVNLWKQQVTEITNAANATDELKKKAASGLQESSTTAKAAGSVASEKQGIKDLEEYSRVLKQITKRKIELADAEKSVESSTQKSNQAVESYVNELKQEILMLTTKLDLLEKGMTDTDALTEATENRALAEQRVKTAIAESNTKGKEQLTLVDKLKSSFKDYFNNFMSYGLVNNAMNAMTTAIRQSIDTVIELNTAMTDVQMVTGETASQTAELAREYSEMAQSLGATTTQIANGASEWLRQGKSIEETNQLLEASMVLSKVGAIESSQATELLTSTLNGYKMEAEDAMHVVDAMSKVDLEAATSVEELAVALQSTANMARVNGVGFEELLGMVGSVSEATRRSASVVGNSFKTIFSRLTNVAAGKMTDDQGEALNDVEQVLNGLNIKLRDTTGQFRNMYDVISDVADNWQNYTNVEQAWIATSVAGTRQRETFLALMENWDRSLELSAAAMDSEGMAMEKMDIYLQSIQAHINSLKAAFENLVYSEGFVNLINLVLESLTKLINFIGILADNKLVQLATMFGTVTVAISKFSNALKNSSKVIKTISSVSKVFMDGFIPWAANGSKLIGVMGGLKAAIASLTKTMLASPLFWGVVAAGVVYGITQAVDALITTTEEYKETLAEIESQLSEVSGKRKALEEKAEVEQLTEAEQAYLDVLKAEESILDRRRKETAQKTYESEARDVERGGTGFMAWARELAWNNAAAQANMNDPFNLAPDVGPYNVAVEELTKNIEEYKQVTQDLNNSNGKSLEEYEELQSRQTELSDALLVHISRITKAKEEGLELTDTDKQLAEIMEEAGITAESLSDALKGVSNELDGTGDDIQRITQEVSGLQSAYDNLISVEEEIAETGTLSIETLDSIVSRYPQLNEAVTNYLLGLASTEDVLAAIQEAYKVDEENAYNNIINKLKMQSNYYSILPQMDAALMNQLASNYNLDLDNHSTYAQAKGDIEMSLLQELSDKWGAFYGAQFKSLQEFADFAQSFDGPEAKQIQADAKKYSERFAEAQAALDKVYDDSIKLRLDGYKQVSSAAKDAAKAGGSSSSKQSEQEKAYNDLLEMTIKMLKKKKELEKEALKEQLDGYKKVIDAQKDLLDLQDDEYNHKREVEDQNKNISSLEAQIAELQFDTSAEGTKKRLELEEELAEAKRDLEDYQHDYSIDQQKDALDREEERFEEYINGQIDEIDRYLDKTGEITAEAIRLINERSEALFNDLIQYNRAYGDSLDKTVLDAWNGAIGKVNEYKEACDRAYESASRAASLGGGSSYTVSSPSSGNSGVGMAAMRPANSPVVDRTPKYYIYKTGTTKPISGALSLEEAQRVWGYIPDPKNYYWQKFEGITKKNLVYGVKPYHTGLDAGFVGGLKGNEEFIKALKGEAFITKEQQNRFMNKILPDIVSTGASSLGSMSFGNLLNIEVQGNLDSSVVPRIEDITKDVVKQINQTMFRGGYKRNTSVVPI